MKWVLIKKVVEIIGCTENAVRAKMKKGVWLKDIHWRKADDNRIYFNIEAIYQWIEGKKA